MRKHKSMHVDSRPKHIHRFAVCTDLSRRGSYACSVVAEYNIVPMMGTRRAKYELRLERREGIGQTQNGGQRKQNERENIHYSSITGTTEPKVIPIHTNLRTACECWLG
jgi:hypothetical protein